MANTLSRRRRSLERILTKGSSHADSPLHRAMRRGKDKTMLHPRPVEQALDPVNGGQPTPSSPSRNGPTPHGSAASIGGGVTGGPPSSSGPAPAGSNVSSPTTNNLAQHPGSAPVQSSSLARRRGPTLSPSDVLARLLQFSASALERSNPTASALAATASAVMPRVDSRSADRTKATIVDMLSDRSRTKASAPTTSLVSTAAGALTGLLGGPGARTRPIPQTVPRRNNTQRPVGQAGRVTKPSGAPKVTKAERQDERQAKQTADLVAKLARRYPELAQEGELASIIGAGAKYDVNPSVLASIYREETASGDNVAVSSADAQGPMQFLESTFATQGVDSPLDKGKSADIQSTTDAIYSAANYLNNSGFKDDPRSAIFAYNHADWYVDAVVQGAKDYAALDRVPTDTRGALVEPPSRETVTRFQAMVDEAKKIESAALPYVYGGAHVAGTAPGPKELARAGSGYDCSSSVSRVLQAAGIDIPTIVSGDFPNYTEAGPGAVTIYSNPGHVFMKIGNRYFGTSSTNPEGGAGFIDRSVGQSEAESGSYTVTHVPGMGQEIARRMGVRLDGAGAAPGMTISSGGGVATINPGQGVLQSTPGPSNKPIISDRAATAAGISPIRHPLSARAALPQALLGGDSSEELENPLFDVLKPKRRLT